MSSEQASQLVSELFDIIDGAHWDDLDRVFTDDCVYERPGYPPLRGLDRLRQFYDQERIIAQGRHMVTRVVGDFDSAACWGSFAGVSRSGERLAEEFVDTYSIVDGRIRHRKTFFYRPAI